MNKEEEKLNSYINEILEETIKSSLSTLPAHLKEAIDYKKTLTIVDPSEFVFGLILGQALGLITSVFVAAKLREPTKDDRIMLRNKVYSKIPELRDQVDILKQRLLEEKEKAIKERQEKIEAELKKLKKEKEKNVVKKTAT